MAVNSFDELTHSCRQFEIWPRNLVLKQHLPRVLQNYQKRLSSDETRLFSTSRACVDCWEAPVGKDMFEEIQLNNQAELQEWLGRHLHHREKDPWSRHVFLSAPHSRAALDCTAPMFQLLCSYQQVSPVLIDMMASFGKQYRPADFHSVSFTQDDLPKPAQGSNLAIPEIGRSGWELRHCYKLHGLEQSDFDGKWTMRQTAIYHSFDRENGRAFWLTIKANNEIRDRVKDGIQSLDVMKATCMNTLGSSFMACLATHLVTIDWCAEGWRWQIGDVEKQTRETLVRVKSTRVEPLADEHFTPELVNALSMPSGQGIDLPFLSKHPKSNSHKSISQTPYSLTAWVRNASQRGTATQHQQVQLGILHPVQETTEDKQGRITKYLERLKEFSFSEFQNLNSFAMKLQELKLAMNLDIRVLREFREYYQRHYESPQFPEEIKEACSKTGFFDHFIQRIQSVERHLEAECSRAETMIVLIEDGKRLYDSILQSYNTEINRLFALNGQKTSMRMEAVTDSMYIMARQTARDSASMHVITFITLLLLPGTFLGTFFSTPIIDDSGQIDNRFLVFFIEICIPLTVFTLFIWGVYMRWFKKNKMEQYSMC